MPAGPGFGGVLVRRWNTDGTRPRGALVFADQEGGSVKRFRSNTPWRAASAYRSSAGARTAGVATAAGLRRVGVHAALAPGSICRTALGCGTSPGRVRRRSPGLGRAACVKHFPGLGSTPESTDVARVYGVLRSADLAPFQRRSGQACPRDGRHAIYPRLGPRRASLEPKTYELLRRIGFRGVAITDSLGSSALPGAYWARLALRAGADLVLTTQWNRSTLDGWWRRSCHLRRQGELDAKLVRVLRYRRLVGTVN